jgi:hypothetical protein
MIPQTKDQSLFLAPSAALTVIVSQRFHQVCPICKIPAMYTSLVGGKDFWADK